MEVIKVEPNKKKINKSTLIAWAIAIPSIILYIFFLWGPLIQNVIFSFFKTNNFDMVGFNGFNNYIGVFKDPRFVGALKNTLLYVVYSLLIGFIIPIILALVISEVVRGKSIFKVGFYLPNIVPAIAVILMWKIMMDPNDYGFFNILLNKVGLKSSMWISNETMSIPLIVLTLTWKSAGSTMLIYLATIQSIDNSLYEATRIKGFSVWKRLKYVTFPALKANVKLLLIMQIISIFQIFYEPMIFMGQTNDQANTLGLLIYKLIYTKQNTGEAAALGVITMLILLIFTAVYLYFDKRTQDNQFKDKIYITLAELEAKEKNKRGFSKAISNFFQKVFKAIYKFLETIKVVWLYDQIKRFFNFIFNKTSRVSLKLFKKKEKGILTYSDYKKPSNRIRYYLMYTILTLGLIVVLVPFIWLFVTSFKDANEILQLPKDYHFFPKSFNFGKYIDVIKKTEIMKNVSNTLIIAFGAVICSIVFNGLLAYFVSILKPKGSKVIFYLILISMLIPPAVALVPLYKNIIGFYSFISKITGLSLRSIQSSFITLVPFWFIAAVSPFNFLLFKSHFDSLPKDLFEVAEIEGASKLQVFSKIIVPLSYPIMIVVAIFTVTSTWNDFLLPYIMINNQEYWTVMIKLFKVNAEMFTYGIALDEFLSLLLFTMIPPMILFFIFQRQITENSTASGIK